MAYIVQPCANFSEINYLCIFGRNHGHLASLTEQLRAHSQYTLYSWKEGTLHGVKYRQNDGAVLLVNVLASPHPRQSPDCIPIVGSVKS